MLENDFGISSLKHATNCVLVSHIIAETNPEFNK